MRSYFFPCAPREQGGRVRCLCLNRAAKSKDPSSDTWARPTFIISSKSSGLRVLLPRHATSPKDLGTYSPREIHMRKPMSGRARRSTYAPILGFSHLTSTGKVKPVTPQDSRHNPQRVHRSRRNGLHRAEANRAKFKMPKMLKEFALTHAPHPSRVFLISHSMSCLHA